MASSEGCTLNRRNDWTNVEQVLEKLQQSPGQDKPRTAYTPEKGPKLIFESGKSKEKAKSRLLTLPPASPTSPQRSPQQLPPPSPPLSPARATPQRSPQLFSPSPPPFSPSLATPQRSPQQFPPSPFSPASATPQRSPQQFSPPPSSFSPAMSTPQRSPQQFSPPLSPFSPAMSTPQRSPQQFPPPPLPFSPAMSTPQRSPQQFPPPPSPFSPAPGTPTWSPQQFPPPYTPQTPQTTQPSRCFDATDNSAYFTPSSRFGRTAQSMEGMLQTPEVPMSARTPGFPPEPFFTPASIQPGEELPGRRKKLKDNWITVVPTPKELPERPIPKSFRQMIKEAEAEEVSPEAPRIIPRKHWVSTLPSALPEPRRYYEAPPVEPEIVEPEGPPGPIKPRKHWVKVMPSTIELPPNWGLPREQRRPVPHIPQEPEPPLPPEAPIQTPKSPYRSPQPSYPSPEDVFAPTRPTTQEAGEVKNDPFFSSNKVYSLNMNNFWEFIGEKDVALIMFYDPGNNSVFYSKEQFSQAAEKAKRRNHAFAAVDCSKEEGLCKWEDALQKANNPVFKLYSRGDLIGWYRNFQTFSSKLMAKYVEFCPVKNMPPCE